MSWCLVAIWFISFIWLAILTIEFSDFKNNTEYKLKQMKKWYKLDKKYKKWRVKKKKWDSR